MNEQLSPLDRERAITKELCDNLKGQWARVLAHVIPELADAIAAGPRKHVDCPFHGGKNDFRIHQNFDESGGCICTCNREMTDGFKVIMYARNCSFMDAKQYLIDALGGRITTDHLPPPVRRREPNLKEIAAKDAKIRQRVERTWADSHSLSDSRSRPARNWLESRGVGSNLNLPSVQCHPALAYWNHDDEKGRFVRLGNWPAIVSLVQCPDGRAATIHRAWLTADGRSKAPVPEQRKQEQCPSTVDLAGAAIRLDRFEHPVLSLAEGLESALSARLLTSNLGLPAWSTLNSVLLEKVVVPEYVQVVVIWADRDRGQAGQHAAVALCKRLRSEGKRAVVMLPPYAIPEGKRSLDWNDVVMLEGVERARAHPAFRAWRLRLAEVLRELNHNELAERFRHAA
ncbi:MAG: hypothetical protein ABS98_06365 [Lysobacteraceae bacterium SCN 69-48]|nr:MAG: hypothetical protein ABS98_06365 [Xanthomonadaceae bacterium SCN 69-48]